MFFLRIKEENVDGSSNEKHNVISKNDVKIEIKIEKNGHSGDEKAKYENEISSKMKQKNIEEEYTVGCIIIANYLIHFFFRNTKKTNTDKNYETSKTDGNTESKTEKHGHSSEEDSDTESKQNNSTNKKKPK